MGRKKIWRLGDLAEEDPRKLILKSKKSYNVSFIYEKAEDKLKGIHLSNTIKPCFLDVSHLQHSVLGQVVHRKTVLVVNQNFSF